MSTTASDAGEQLFEREIKQIIPSPGYSALFFDEEDGEPWAGTLVGWALFSESTGNPDGPQSRTSVIGLVADGKSVLFVDEFPNFVGYLSPEGRFEDWRADARQAWQEQQARGSTPPSQRRKIWHDDV